MFSILAKELGTYLPSEKIDLIHTAFQFATEAHQEQTRSTGEPYITHPIEVALILAKMHLDVPTIIASLLHDVIEDTHVAKREISKKFGKDVAELVDGVTKLTQIEFESKAQAQAEYFRKMMMAMADDIRVILIKLADRLHNMRTLRHVSPEKRRRKARETLEIYAPIANRLGMHNFRLEFEELGFEMLHPLRFRVLKEAVIKARGNRKEIIEVIESSLRKAIDNAHLKDFSLKGREKHLYSIYKKMRNKHLRFSEVMDVYAFRLIVNAVDECYRVLGIVHSLYKPVPEKFKDYIAIPKANGYQSLHTILFGPYGVPIEIQIRTQDMDNLAENGIAAHWLYKSEENVIDQAQLRAREWIRGLLEMQKSAGNSLEFVENVKIDLFPDEIYVFTPKGNIIKLPSGATPVDFAYAVHSDIGNSCVAVKIDRRLSPLSSQLQNGQTIEVVTVPGARPNPAWLNFIVTGKARSSIRHFLKHQRRKESITLGKRLLEKALKGYKVSLRSISKQTLQTLLKVLNFKSVDELYENVGLGNQLAPIIVRRLLAHDDFQLTEQVEQRALIEPLYIKGTEGLVVHFAKCCRPIPGDPIEGVLTAGQGIVVHHAECHNLVEFRRQPDKCIPVRWEENMQGDFEVELHIAVINQRGVFANLALAIADAEANIENINIAEQGGRCTIIKLVLSVHDRAHLAHVLRRLHKLKSISKITRIHNG